MQSLALQNACPESAYALISETDTHSINAGTWCCVWWLLMVTTWSEENISWWNMLRIPDHQWLHHLVIQIDIVIEVHFYHSMCAQFQYSAQMCIVTQCQGGWFSWVTCTQPVTADWNIFQCGCMAKGKTSGEADYPAKSAEAIVTV